MTGGLLTIRQACRGVRHKVDGIATFPERRAILGLPTTQHVIVCVTERPPRSLGLAARSRSRFCGGGAFMHWRVAGR